MPRVRRSPVYAVPQDQPSQDDSARVLPWSAGHGRQSDAKRALPSSWLALIALIGLTVALPAILAAASGNLSIPHNDAYAYSLIAQRFARTGVIQLVGWNHPFTVGQAVILGPLASSIVVQQLFVAGLAVIGLAATYALLRLSLSPGRALFGTAVVAALPGFGLLATSFMEDVPAFTAIVLTLLIGTMAISRRSIATLTLAVVIGVWGFTIREQGIAAVVAILAAAFASSADREWRRKLIVLTAAALLAMSGSEAWRRSLANGQSPHLAFSLHTGVFVCLSTYFTLGLLMLPASLAATHPRSWGRPARVLCIVTGLVGIALVVKHHSLLLGNYLDRHGAYPGVLPGTRSVLPGAIWDGVKLGALIGGSLLFGLIVERVRRLDLSLALFGGLTVAGTVVEAFVGEPTLDRFLLPLLPVALVLVLPAVQASRISAPRAVSASGVLALLMVVSVVIMVNGFAFDSARWDAAKSVVARGVSPQAVDAGLEWVGYHSPVPAINARPSAARAHLPFYAQTLFPRARECFVLTSSPLKHLGHVTRTFGYHTFLVFGHSRLLLYDTGRCR